MRLPVRLWTCVLLPSVICVGWTCAAAAQWKQLAVEHFDWGSPANRFTFVLEAPADGEGSPGAFARLRIQRTGDPELVITDDEGLVDFRKDNCSFHFAFCKRSNLLRSKYLLLLPASKSELLLFLFGYQYASSPGSLHVILLRADGPAREILSEPEFDMYDFRDLDGDGAPEIVGKKCMSETWGNGLLSYDPYSVYKLPLRSAGPAKYSLALSKQYNLRNYYGWAGPDSRVDVAIVLHPPAGKKPVILSREAAEKLSESSSRK